MIDQPLLATDFTSRSELALDRALVLASGQADKIGALHGIDGTVSAALLRAEESATPPVMAERLGLLAQTDITAVHARWPPVPNMVTDGSMQSELLRTQKAAEKSVAKKEMDAFLSGLNLGQHRLDRKVIEGTPQMAVRACIADFAPDLVVLGTRGRSGILRLVLGSVAEDLLSWLAADVLVVPPEEAA